MRTQIEVLSVPGLRRRFTCTPEELGLTIGPQGTVVVQSSASWTPGRHPGRAQFALPQYRTREVTTIVTRSMATGTTMVEVTQWWRQRSVTVTLRQGEPFQNEAPSR